MNLTRIYKAIDEGLKQSLIDFGNNKILKSSLVDKRLIISEQDMEDWYESGEDMPEDMYEELCKDRYIGFYKPENKILFFDIFKRLNFKNINLNWIDPSRLRDIEFIDKPYKYGLDIRHWNNINKLYRMFIYNSTLSSIKIPNSVTSIKDGAFATCYSLASIQLPDGLTSIGVSAFGGCKLTSIKLPDSVTFIGYSAFGDCNQLTSINIPDGVTIIGNSTFNGCDSLISINIPDSVTYIDKYAFEYCESLPSINIPNSVTNIDNLAFSECKSLTSIQYGGTKKQWNAIKLGKDPFYSVNCIVHCLDGDIKING